MIRNMLLLKGKSVLLTEDDTIARTQISEILEMLFAKVYTAENGHEAYRMYEDESPDIIITDSKIPKKDGLSLIKRVRQNDYNIPILLMTNFAEPELLFDAVNLSVDGCLIKPIELEKLTFSLCRAIQRTQKNEGLIVLGSNLFYNSATKELYHNGAVVTLGVKEQELLLLLIKNRHATVSKNEIAEALWPLDPICESAIKNIILRLRKKLGLDIIISVRGIGYRLDTRKFPRPSV